MNRLMLAAVAVLLPVAAHAKTRPVILDYLPDCATSWNIYPTREALFQSGDQPKFMVENGPRTDAAFIGIVLRVGGTVFRYLPPKAKFFAGCAPESGS